MIPRGFQALLIVGLEVSGVAFAANSVGEAMAFSVLLVAAALAVLAGRTTACTLTAFLLAVHVLFTGFAMAGSESQSIAIGWSSVAAFHVIVAVVVVTVGPFIRRRLNTQRNHDDY